MPDKLMIKSYAAYLKTMGAYVQEPDPGLVALDNKEVVAPFDATALYPTTEILTNIGFETLYGKVYDVGMIDSVINLFYTIEVNFKKVNFEETKTELILNQGMMAFSNALKNLLKIYCNNRKPSNKKDFTDVNYSLFMNFFNNIVQYIKRKNSFENIFTPTDDETYKLLRSNLFNLLEGITFLSEKNRGYNLLIVDFIYLPEIFYSKYNNKKIYVFENVLSTKIQLKIYNTINIDDLFLTKILNPFGTLFYKHKEKLAFSASENIKGLKRRKKIKNEMLCLEGLLDSFEKLKEIDVNFFREQSFVLTEDEIRSIYSVLDNVDYDNEALNWRVQFLKTEFPSGLNDYNELKRFIKIRAQQLNSEQLGIKVTLNSGYGITGMLTYMYSSPLISNSITTAGKIYGIKTFQKISSELIHYETSKFSKEAA